MCVCVCVIICISTGSLVLLTLLVPFESPCSLGITAPCIISYIYSLALLEQLNCSPECHRDYIVDQFHDLSLAWLSSPISAVSDPADKLSLSRKPLIHRHLLPWVHCYFPSSLASTGSSLPPNPYMHLFSWAPSLTLVSESVLSWIHHFHRKGFKLHF